VIRVAAGLVAAAVASAALAQEAPRAYSVPGRGKVELEVPVDWYDEPRPRIGGHRRQHGPVASCVPAPLFGVQLAEPLLARGAAHDEDAPGLAVPAGRRPGSGLNDAPDRGLGDRIGAQPAHGAQRAHRFVEADLWHRRSPALSVQNSSGSFK